METERLTLRQWVASDREPFAKLNADLEVMEYFPEILSEGESNSLVERLESKINEMGWGVWAVELKGTNTFIGFVGLNSPSEKLPFSPCVEIAWRLSKKYWGKGYATEAAQAALRFAFEDLHLDAIVAFTTVKNIRSQAVMEKISMLNTQQNFLHPSVPDDNELQEHVLYKITQKQWASAF
jgi:RimJ/RimL family protein N-acetyltransferase